MPISIKLTFIFVLLLFSCNSGNSDNRASAVDSVSTNVSSTDTQKINECVRGKAEPCVDKKIFPNTTFELQKDSISALETVLLDGDEKLTIHNYGCEYYNLDFRFETSRFHDDPTDLIHWFEHAVVLIEEIKPGINAPVDLPQGIKALINYIIKSKGKLSLNEEVDYGTGEIRHFVMIKSIERINDSKYAIEISFAVGPL